MKRNLYIISGLGTDERALQGIVFPENSKPVFIPWHLPNPNTTLKEYAAELAKNITGENPLLLGVSFGGMVATEIAKIVNPDKLILVASVMQHMEIPFLYRLLGLLGVNHLIPAKLFLIPSVVTNWFFCAKRREHKKMLAEILRDTNPNYFKWALNSIVHWKQTETVSVVRIHGCSDRVLPISKKKQYDFLIRNGGHFMTVTHSNEISECLAQILTD